MRMDLFIFNSIPQIDFPILETNQLVSQVLLRDDSEDFTTNIFKSFGFSRKMGI